MPDYQMLFNVSFSAILLGAGWLMRVLFETIKDLRDKDQKIYDKVSSLAVTLPENYVSKRDFKDLNDRIFAKLDRIENKIDTKADKK